MTPTGLIRSGNKQPVSTGMIVLLVAVLFVAGYGLVRTGMLNNEERRIAGQLDRAAAQSAFAIEKILLSSFEMFARLQAQGVGSCGRSELKLFNRETRLSASLLEVGLANPAGQLVCSQAGRRLKTHRVLQRQDSAQPNIMIDIFEATEQTASTIVISQQLSAHRRLYAILNPKLLAQVFRNAELPPNTKFDIFIADIKLWNRRTDDAGKDIRQATAKPARNWASGTGIIDGERIEIDPTVKQDILRAQWQSKQYPIRAIAEVPASQIFGNSVASRQNLMVITLLLFAMSATGVFMFRKLSLGTDEPDCSAQLEGLTILPYYHPVFDLQSGQMSGLEVLARWHSDEKGVFAAEELVMLAESTGEIMSLTQDLMTTATEHLGPLLARNPGYAASFNLSAQHFSDPDFADEIHGRIIGAGINPGQIVVELAERKPLEDRDAAAETVARFKELGFQVALDDAGSGYLGLDLLHELNIDMVKIDKVFVDSLKEADNPDNVINKIIELAMAAGKQIIAEGVEAEIQVQRLQQLGVERAQGFLFAEPMGWSEFVEFVRGQQGDVSLIDNAVELQSKMRQTEQAA